MHRNELYHEFMYGWVNMVGGYVTLPKDFSRPNWRPGQHLWALSNSLVCSYQVFRLFFRDLEYSFKHTLNKWYRLKPSTPTLKQLIYICAAVSKIEMRVRKRTLQITHKDVQYIFYILYVKHSEYILERLNQALFITLLEDNTVVVGVSE